MKKSSLLLAALGLLALPAQAQITLHASDFAFGGSAVVASDTTLAVIPPGGIGEQVWDFTGLKDEKSQTLVFSNADGVTFQPFFPQANRASVESTANSGNFKFYQLDNQSLKYHGRHRFTTNGNDTLTTTHIQVEPGESLIRFPASFGDSFQEDVKHSITLSTGELGPFVRFTKNAHRMVWTDAWGTLNTPTGSYKVLRFTEVITSLDSTFNYSPGTGTWVFSNGGGGVDTSYHFWTNQNGLPVPVVDLYPAPFGGSTTGTTTITWLKDFVSEASQAALSLEVRLFPNPASGWLSVEVPEQFEGRLEIWDFHGRLAFSKQAESGLEKVDVSALPVGAYAAVLKDGEGGLAGFQRFEVAR